MKQLIIMLAIGLGIPLFDPKQKQNNYSLSRAGHSYEEGSELKKKKNNKKRQSYLNKKFKKQKKYYEKNYSLKGTHSKDARYSNQRKIRRMHTSC